MRIDLLTRAAVLGTLLAGVARAEVIDRVVAVIDREPITLSEAERAQRIQQLKGETPAALRDVVERLIEARLIAREVARYPDSGVTEEEVDHALDSIRRAVSTQPAFEDALARAELTQADLRREIANQLRTTLYVEKRFRIQVQVSPDDVRRYYEGELREELATAGKPLPPLESVEGEIRALLAERELNRRVAEWIGELKTQARIRRHVW